MCNDVGKVYIYIYINMKSILWFLNPITTYLVPLVWYDDISDFRQLQFQHGRVAKEIVALACAILEHSL